jgi:hypothetical protein
MRVSIFEVPMPLLTLIHSGDTEPYSAPQNLAGLADCREFGERIQQVAHQIR